jgi:7,8-dihydro-6-hydroxymethylpterin-pyrophosphokinase
LGFGLSRNRRRLAEGGAASGQLAGRIEVDEDNLWRTIAERWAPRIIDLDILTYDKIEIAEEGLNFPHKHISERPRPVAEIDTSFMPALHSLGPTAMPACEKCQHHAERRRRVIDIRERDARHKKSHANAQEISGGDNLRTGL